MTEDEFRTALAADGFGEPNVVTYAPNQRPDLHDHPFDARVLITDGVLHMTYPESLEELEAGRVCDVPAGTVHAECCGPAGAVGLLGTRTRGRKPSDRTG